MKNTILTLLAFVLAFPLGFSQTPAYIKDGALLDGKNIVKANITSFAFKSVGFSYERILTKKLSAVLAVNHMPASSIPYINTILNLSSADSVTTSILNGMKISNFSFSPELRIYLLGGYGNGFYISPYYRFEKFGTENVKVNYVANNKNETVVIDGNLTAYGGGLLLGYQWLAGKKKNIVIDWTFIGAHYGTSAGNFFAETTQKLTPNEQNDVRQAIDENLSKIPMLQYKSTVTENTADIDINGPWAFLRGSLSVGFRF